ncbi:MAG: hypothetical protein H6702_22565 [Myxococcales bacterium]|nr:hypothetical protein [Myxococcales bacterium]
MSHPFAPLARALRRGAPAAALAQAMTLAGCECPEPSWVEAQQLAHDDPLVEAKLADWLADQASSDPAQRLRELLGLAEAAVPPPQAPYSYFGRTYAALLRDAGAAADAEICAALCARVVGASTYSPEPVECHAEATDQGPTLDCRWFQPVDCVAGRRPAGLVSPPPPFARDAVGAWWAAMAHEEAAAVHAFARLLADLARLGAPADLVTDARQALVDEVHHLALAAAQAHRLGARVDLPQVPVPTPRPAEAVAHENATAGCVHEAFAALEATWQASRVADPDARAVLARVAADEARHAALSARIHHWLMGTLAPATQARVEAARAAELARLGVTLAQRPEAPVDPRPGRRDALALWAALSGAASTPNT